MQTRLCRWLDVDAMKPRFGVQVRHDGGWHHAHENGKPCIYDTEQEAEVKRDELRKKKWDLKKIPDVRQRGQFHCSSGHP